MTNAYTLVIDGVTMDLFGDETLQLTRQVKDIQDLREVQADFTQSFTLPASNRNNPVFDNWWDEDVELSTWNPYLKLTAEIRVHSLPIFEGVVELTGIKKRDGLPYSYTVIFYGQIKDALSSLGEATLQDIDWSAYDHTVNYGNIVSSWDGLLVSGDILYPVADYYTGFVYSQFYLPNNVRHTGSGIAINDTRPWIRLKAMVTNVLTQAGYSVQAGGLLDETRFDDIFVCPMAQAGPLQDPTDEQAKVNVNAGAGPIVLAATGAGLGWFSVPLNTAASDPLGLWNTISYNYTCPFNGDFEWQLDFDITSLGPTSGVTFALTRNGSVIHWWPTVTATGAQTKTARVTLQKGDRIKLEYIGVGASVTFADITLQITKVPFGIDGKALDMAITMPTISCSEFLRSFLQTFNAVMTNVDDSTVLIEAMPDWFAAGTQRDFTQYIDTREIDMEKLKIPKRVHITHQEGLDLANQAFISLNGRRFGEIKFEPNVDFADAPLEIETVFNVMPPTIMREINDKGEILWDTDLPVMYFLDQDGKAVHHPLTLAYYVGKQAINFDYYWGGSLQTNFPVMSAFAADPTVATTESLTFGMEASRDGDTPTETLYQQFYQSTLERLYSTNSRIIKHQAHIPVGIWLELQMNDTLTISGRYYNIKSIVYDILTERADLELITYPDINLTTWSSSGRLPSWTGGASKPFEGEGMLTGFTPRRISNVNDADGTFYNTLNDQVTYNLTVLNNRQQLFKANDRINSLTGYNDATSALAVTGAPIIIPLGASWRSGDDNRLTFDNANDSIYDDYGGEFRVTAHISYEQDGGGTGGRDMEFYLAIDGTATLAKAMVYGDSAPVTLEWTGFVQRGSALALYVYDLNGESHTLDVNFASLKVELK